MIVSQRGPKTLFAHHALVCNQGLNPDKPSFCEEDVCHWDLTLFGFHGKQIFLLHLFVQGLLSKALTIFDRSERTNVDTRLIISVKEARKLLGKESAGLSSEEIEKLIISLSKMAEGFLADGQVPNTNEV